MYQYIKGNIEEIGEDYIVIENNDIGYMINTSKTTIMQIGNNLQHRKIYTFLNVKEDGVSLYGFTTKDELDMFKLLQTVSKIGPKVAIGMLSIMIPSDIKLAIISEDSNKLSKAPGVGKKTASRIILELKDKIGDIESIIKSNSNEQIIVESSISNEKEEVLDALVSLGYTRSEVYSAIAKIDTSNKSVEDIIKLVLKELGK